MPQGYSLSPLSIARRYRRYVCEPQASLRKEREQELDMGTRRPIAQGWQTEPPPASNTRNAAALNTAATHTITGVARRVTVRTNAALCALTSKGNRRPGPGGRPAGGRLFEWRMWRFPVDLDRVPVGVGAAKQGCRIILGQGSAYRKARLAHPSVKVDHGLRRR
jgi:hypothetical protein